MKLSELTPEKATMLSEMKFEFMSHASYSTGGDRWEKCNYKGLNICLNTWTRRKGAGWGLGKNTYYIDGEKRGYKDLNEFLEIVKQRTSMQKV